MALFETCSDDGKRSEVLTEKFTCCACGQIKPFYNVREARSFTPEISAPDLSQLAVCRCEEETCLQWFKRIVGFGPEKNQEVCKTRILPDSKSQDVVKLKPSGRSFHRSGTSKSETRCAKGYESESEATRGAQANLVDEIANSLRATPSAALESRFTDAETEEHSQTSKDSAVGKKKKKKKKPGRGRMGVFSLRDSSELRDQLKRVRSEKFGIPASTATVFQTYRSRALYTPLRDFHSRKTATKKGASTKALVNQNSKHVEFRSGSKASVGSAGSNVSTSSAEKNFSASHSGGYSYRKFLEQGLRESQPAVRRSRSGPQTQQDYQETFAQSAMTRIFYSRTPVDELLPLRYPKNRFSRFSACPVRSGPEVCRSQSFTTGEEGKTPTSRPSSQPPPYPVVLSCVSPSLRKTSQVQKREGAKPGQKLKQGSCPSFLPFQPGGQEVITSRLVHSHLRRSKFIAKSAVGLSTGANCAEPRGRLATKRGRKPVRYRTRTSVRGGYSPSASAPIRHGRSLTPRAMYCQMPVAFNGKENPKKQKENSKVCEVIQRCNVKRRPPRSCPPDCVGTAISPGPDSRRLSKQVSLNYQPSPPRFRSASRAGSKQTAHLNFTQSSNAGRSPESNQCSKCKTPVMHKKSAHPKTCKCDIMLPPTCVRRGGPRSTVKEYLSTIEHPKPRFRPACFNKTPSKIQSKDGEIKSDKESVGSSKGSGTASKKKKTKVRMKTEPIPETEEETAKPGTEDGGLKTGLAKSASMSNQRSPAEPKEPKEQKDGNNNHGLDGSAPITSSHVRFTDHSTYPTPTRVSSVPAHGYTSYLDSGYARVNSTPYSASYGLRASYGNSPYSSPPDFGYLRAAHEFRRAIRENYEQRRLITHRSTPVTNANLNAWRASVQDSHISQFQSWSPAIRVSLQTRSPEKPRRKKEEVSPNKSIGPRKKSKPKLETRSLRAKRVSEAKATPTSQSPQRKASLPLYFPKKSFLEGEVPVYIKNQDNRKNQSSFDKNTSKSQFAAETPKENVKEEAECRVNVAEQKTEPASSTSQTALVESPCEKENDAPSETFEKSDGQTKDPDDGQNEEPSKATLDTAVEKHREDGPPCGEKDPDTEAKAHTTAMLQGKESSVDCEGLSKQWKTLPSSVRKIEPKGTFLKIILPESSTASIGAQSTAHTSTSPTAPPSLPKSSVFPNFFNSAAPRPGDGDNPFQVNTGNASGQVPVFQGLMERFSEKVEIYVRTKDGEQEVKGGKNTVPRDAGDTQGAAAPSGSKLLAMDGSELQSCDARRGEKTLEAAAESVVACSPDNKSRNRAAPNCEATSECVSWSEVAHLTQVGAKQPPLCQPASAVSSCATLAPLQAAGGDPLPCPAAAEAQSYKMEVEVRTTTEHVYLENTPSTAKPASNIFTSLKQAILGPALTARDRDTPVDECASLKVKRHGSGTYVVNPPPALWTGAGEAGQVIDLSAQPAPRPRKSRSDATYVRAHKNSVCGPVGAEKLVMGSSVDPAPGAESDAAVTRDILEVITGNPCRFQKVAADHCDGAMIMSAKSQFLKNLRGNSMTNIPVKVSPAVMPPGSLSAVVCRSFDNTFNTRRCKPVRVGSLTEAMKTFISKHGTPV
ncbi:hypothetical protein ElyMa_002737700 [Elysia marginata]|uniref:Uncharacterized protein n=1 Tax=Elysia marginata TaxID=1093978 RepID=A0AAV4HGQ6_9GAST|nr:hypothetical protein ElyMa_002737700 [Elysia marginata]